MALRIAGLRNGRAQCAGGVLITHAEAIDLPVASLGAALRFGREQPILALNNAGTQGDLVEARRDLFRSNHDRVLVDLIVIALFGDQAGGDVELAFVGFDQQLHEPVLGDGVAFRHVDGERDRKGRAQVGLGAENMALDGANIIIPNGKARGLCRHNLRGDWLPCATAVLIIDSH